MHIPWWGFLLIGIAVISIVVGVKLVAAITHIVVVHNAEIDELKGRADDLESRIDDLESRIEDLESNIEPEPNEDLPPDS
jgi:cell division protein FtsL